MNTQTQQSNEQWLLGPLRKRANNELVKYAVQRQIFCPTPKCGQILDMRTATLFYSETKGSEIICPKCREGISDRAMQEVEAKIPDVEVITYQK